MHDRRDRFDWKDLVNVCAFIRRYPRLLEVRSSRGSFFVVFVGFFGAMDAGRGGHRLDPRFLSLCTVFSLPGPSDDAIRHVFGSVLSAHTACFADDVKSTVQGVVDATVRLYRVRAPTRLTPTHRAGAEPRGVFFQLAREQLRRTPDKFLHVFDLSHVGGIVNGMTRTSPDTFTTAESFVRVWRNEFTRAMCDRLRCRQVCASSA